MSAAEKSKIGYFRAQIEFDQADLQLRFAAEGGKQPGPKLLKKRDEGRSKRDECQENYQGCVATGDPSVMRASKL